VIGGDDQQASQPLPGPPPDAFSGLGFALDPVPGLGFATTDSAVAGLDANSWRSYRAAFDEGALP
jgi:hypothetical protein